MCGEGSDSMDKESNETTKNKGGKETFIFGSWKCRNSKKKRISASDLEREKSPYTKRDVNNSSSGGGGSKNAASNNQNSLPSPSNCLYNSCTGEEQNEVNLTTRRAISVYDQLHEQDFWCPRCNGKMEEPRLLPCLHSVCNSCVNDFMSKDYRGLSRLVRDDIGDGYQIHRQLEGCPICDFPLPKFGSPVIPPPHYSLQHRLVIYAVRRRLSQRAICCDSCPEEVQATQHCPTCLCNFCQDCGQEHEVEHSDTAQPALRPHQVRPLWEAKRIRHVAVCESHPAHPLRYHCLACQQVTCKECMWQGIHRGHATEDAASAGARAIVQLSATLGKARALLHSLLTDYNERVFSPEDHRSATAFDLARDSVPPSCHFRSRSTLSSHSREARERIQEFSRLRRARYLIDAIFIGEDLLANGSDVEILSLKRIILKRLKFLGVALDSQARYNNSLSKTSRAQHSGIYHCCTFCSSGGKKEATCACGGTMPGGYKGCGHGHSGHPGAHHWSCCGSIYRDGICWLPRKCTYKIML